ncbi:MAG TPA: 50S ribosomal protein L32 [Candidatus Desulfofervidus auxilii]|uniref:Large ribosomal subunit protein bL32 n=1 Tax=Desulfofervidus auxilii TaxID=1621989 RepID=A0A7C0U1M3_DESA2|nr:50S ribosomal protein L32 [Candidatus Desulfofervidus auxilii]
MAVPKRKHSKSRRDKRRTHFKLTPPNLVECPHCHEYKLPHRVCPHCGKYKGEEIIEIKEV